MEDMDILEEIRKTLKLLEFWGTFLVEVTSHCSGLIYYLFPEELHKQIGPTWHDLAVGVVDANYPFGLALFNLEVHRRLYPLPFGMQYCQIDWQGKQRYVLKTKFDPDLDLYRVLRLMKQESKNVYRKLNFPPSNKLEVISWRDAEKEQGGR